MKGEEGGKTRERGDNLFQGLIAKGARLQKGKGVLIAKGEFPGKSHRE